MTQFNRRRFSVPAPGTDEYRDNYEKTFQKQRAGEPKTIGEHLEQGVREAAEDAAARNRGMLEAFEGGVVLAAEDLSRATSKPVTTAHVFSRDDRYTVATCVICGNAPEHEFHHVVTQDRVEAMPGERLMALHLVDDALFLARELADHVLRPTYGEAEAVPSEHGELMRSLNKALGDLNELKNL